MSSTASTPPPQPGSPPGESGGFAALLTSVNATSRADGPGQLVSAIVATQWGANHLQGRQIELVQALHGVYRDQLLLDDLNEYELDLLVGTTPRNDAASDMPVTAATTTDVSDNALSNTMPSDMPGDMPSEAGAAAGVLSTEVPGGLPRETSGSVSIDAPDTTSETAASEPSGGPGDDVDVVERGLALSLFDLDHLMKVETAAARMVSAEVAIAVGWSPREASAVVRRALAWSGNTPTLVQAMTQGHLDMNKAIVIGAATRVLNDAGPEEVDQASAADRHSQTEESAESNPDQHENEAAKPFASQDLSCEGLPVDAVGSGTADSDTNTAPDSGPGQDQAQDQAQAQAQAQDERLAMPVSAADRIAAAVIAKAPGLSRRQVGELADYMVVQHDPSAAERRHQREVAHRGLELEPGFECTATMKVTGAPADRAAAAYNQVDALARRVKATGDGRTLPQLRCDLGLALLAGTARFELVDSGSTSRGVVSGVAAQAAVPSTVPTRSAAVAPRANEPGTNQSGKNQPSTIQPGMTTADRRQQNPMQLGTIQQLRSATDAPSPWPTDRIPAQRGSASGRAASVGCDCAAGGGCQCECGTSYADPAELAPLEQFHRANDAARSASPASPAPPASPETPGTTDTPAQPQPAQTPGSGASPAPAEPSAPTASPAPAEPSAPTASPTPVGSPVPAESLVPAVTPASAEASELGGPPEVEVFPVLPAVPGEMPGRAAGLPGTILTVPLETVLGWISTTPVAQSTNVPPAWMERAGPLVDSIAKRVVTARLAQAEQTQTGEFRIAVTDKQERVVQYHALHARTLRGLLREAVAVDYGSCLFPTCSSPALRCQADHAREYAIVRTTRIGNIEPLCGADHAVKTAGGYRVERTNPHDAGSPATWRLVMRSGHRYSLTTAGERLPIGATRTTKLTVWNPDIDDDTSEHANTTCTSDETDTTDRAARRQSPDDLPPF